MIREQFDALEKEPDELKAYCENARVLINSSLMLLENPHSLEEEENVQYELHVFLSQTPQQNLAKIEARAIEFAAYEVIADRTGVFGVESDTEYQAFCEFADSIRNRVKETNK